MSRILVTGAGGFIGSHLVKRLKADGHFVRGVDLKRPDFEESPADEFEIRDLRDPLQAFFSLRMYTGTPISDIDDVYNLAADMGGIGYITQYLATIARNNVLINVNMLEAARQAQVKRYLYTSSACVYNQDKQHETAVTPLKEEDAYPALPEPGYGWEKLFSEQMMEYYSRDFDLDVRIVRFHNVYGPLGTYDGGKEKSPAALCRKIAEGYWGGELEIWGDGKQTRSYMFIDDCVEGLIRIMNSGYRKPLNLGTEELISIDALAHAIMAVAGKIMYIQHDLSKPQGVRGRNSDNSLLRKILNWEPQTRLIDGLVPTYEWINRQVHPVG